MERQPVDRNMDLLVVKSKALAESGYTNVTSVMAQRVIEFGFQYWRNTRSPKFMIPMNRIAEVFQLNPQARADIKSHIDEVMSSRISIPFRLGETTAYQIEQMVERCFYHPHKGIEFELTGFAIRFLEAQFRALSHPVVFMASEGFGHRSIYANKVFELMACDQGRGYVEEDVDVIRNMLYEASETPPPYKRVKQTLQRSIKAINKKGIMIIDPDIVPIKKEGKTVKRVRINIIENNRRMPQASEDYHFNDLGVHDPISPQRTLFDSVVINQPSPDEIKSQLSSALASVGIQKTYLPGKSYTSFLDSLSDRAKQSGVDVSTLVTSNIDYVEKKKAQSDNAERFNPAYYRSAIENDYASRERGQVDDQLTHNSYTVPDPEETKNALESSRLSDAVMIIKRQREDAEQVVIDKFVSRLSGKQKDLLLDQVCASGNLARVSEDISSPFYKTELINYIEGFEKLVAEEQLDAQLRAAGQKS